MKTMFLDRDGVINVDHGYVSSWDRFEFMPGVIDAMKCLRDHGFQFVVVTNQSGLARGLFDEAQMIGLHEQMRRTLMDAGVSILDVYWCPHHPQGTVPSLSVSCGCRKPLPGLILRAAREHNIDLRRSCMVGDHVRDIQAAQSAGIKNSYLLSADNLAGLDNTTAQVCKDWIEVKNSAIRLEG